MGVFRHQSRLLTNDRCNAEGQSLLTKHAPWAAGPRPRLQKAAAPEAKPPPETRSRSGVQGSQLGRTEAAGASDLCRRSFGLDKAFIFDAF